jgi:hypothetical protein
LFLIDATQTVRWDATLGKSVQQTLIERLCMRMNEDNDTLGQYDNDLRRKTEEFLQMLAATYLRVRAHEKEFFA